MSNIQTIKFYDDELAVSLVDDQPHVSVRHVCDALGLGLSAQLVKLKSAPWGRVSMIDTHDSAGRLQQLSMVSIKSLPMWLATVRVSKVSDDVRAKLAKYQIEAAEVLARHFLGAPASAPMDNPLDDALCDQLKIMLETRRQTIQLERQQARQLEMINATAAIAIKAEAKADEALKLANGGEEWYQVLGYALRHGYDLSNGHLAAIGKLAAKHCEANGIAIRKQPSTKYGQVNVYPAAILDLFRAEFEKRSTKPALTVVRAS